jgi:hypothetical protein
MANAGDARRWIIALLTLTLVAPVAAALASTGSRQQAHARPRASAAVTGDAAVPAFSHLFLIIGENTSASEITAAHAPFMTGVLEPRAARLTDYHSLGQTASTGNYVGLTSGQFIHCEANDTIPSKGCHQSVANLFSQLDTAGVPWQTWAESMDNSCDFLEHGFDWSKNVYSSHHNPALYYTQVTGGEYSEENAPSGECLSRVFSTGSTAPNDTSALDAALASGAVARFDLVVPNDCENGHDPCASNDPVHQFDDFLAREVPKIEASPAFDSRSAIVITWDEGADPPLEPLHPLALVVGPLVRPGAYAEAFNHYSLLRTIEDGFGLAYAGKAAHAAPIAAIWRTKS